jgi:hypothetical protein
VHDLGNLEGLTRGDPQIGRHQDGEQPRGSPPRARIGEQAEDRDRDGDTAAGPRADLRAGQPRVGHRPDPGTQQPSAVQGQAGEQVEHEHDEIAPEEPRDEHPEHGVIPDELRAQQSRAGEQGRYEWACSGNEELVARALRLSLDLGHPAEQEDHYPADRLAECEADCRVT